MGVVVHMNGGRVHCDMLVIAKELGHFFQRDTFGLWQDEEGPDGTNGTNDNEEPRNWSDSASVWFEIRCLQVELPANACERCRGRLEVDQVCNGDCSHRQADA
jgi:hypothetical protein